MRHGPKMMSKPLYRAVERGAVDAHVGLRLVVVLPAHRRRVAAAQRREREELGAVALHTFPAFLAIVPGMVRAVGGQLLFHGARVLPTRDTEGGDDLVA